MLKMRKTAQTSKTEEIPAEVDNRFRGIPERARAVAPRCFYAPGPQPDRVAKMLYNLAMGAQKKADPKVEYKPFILEGWKDRRERRAISRALLANVYRKLKFELRKQKRMRRYREDVIIQNAIDARWAANLDRREAA